MSERSLVVSHGFTFGHTMIKIASRPKEPVIRRLVDERLSLLNCGVEGYVRKPTETGIDIEDFIPYRVLPAIPTPANGNGHSRTEDPLGSAIIYQRPFEEKV